MSVMVAELYDALRAAGVAEGAARSAAQAVLPYDARAELPTVADVAVLRADIAAARLEAKADLADLKADLTWRILLMTGGFVAAVSALKVFA